MALDDVVARAILARGARHPWPSLDTRGTRVSMRKATPPPSLLSMRCGRVMEDSCLLGARVMEASQVMSLLYVLLLVALEQVLLVKEVLKVVKVLKEVEEASLLSFSSTTPPSTPP